MKRRLIAALMVMTSLVFSNALAVNPEVREVDIDVDADTNNVINNADDMIEMDPGGIVFVGSWTNIVLNQLLTTIQPGDTNKVRLSWSNEHVLVSDTLGGSEIIPTRRVGNILQKDYFPSELPKTNWVKGVKPSSFKGEEHFRLEAIHYSAEYDPYTFDEVAITVLLGIDLDIDSDQSTDFGEPQRDDFEEEIEEDGPAPHEALKYVVANDYYQLSMKGMPGYADFDMTDPDGPAESSIIIPIKLEVPENSELDWSDATVTFNYSASSPTLVTSNQTANGDWEWPIPDGQMRLWTVRGPRNSASVLETDGNYVPDNEPIPVDTLGLPGEIFLYLEGITPSEALGADQIKVTLDLPNSILGSSVDVINCTVIKVNVDVDNYNDSEFSTSVHDNLAEDHYEDFTDETNHIGRLLVVDDDDKDMDAIPDFADGYRLSSSVAASITNRESQFVPIIFEIPEPIDLERAGVRLTYSDSNPMGVIANADGTYSLPDDDKKMRIWTKPGNVPRSGNKVLQGGDFLSADEYTAEEFGFSNGIRRLVYYMEAVRPSDSIGDLRILFEVQPDERTGFMAADAVRVTAVQMRMTPDFNRDGEIDDVDKDRLAAKGMFRFWINDDRDKGFWATQAQEDSPKNSYEDIPHTGWWYSWMPFMPSKVGDREMNCDDDKINGIRDMVDFFPVRLEVPSDLLGTNSCRYSLVHDGSAVNIAYTPLDPSVVSEFFQNTNQFNFNLYGINRNEQADAVTTYPVTAQDLVLDKGWLAQAADLETDPVFVMEGRAESLQKPLKLKLKYKDKAIGSWYLGLSVSPVKKMFRYLNVRKADTYFSDHHKPSSFFDPFEWGTRAAKDGLWATDLSNPVNNPDGFYMTSGDTQKTIVWVHGLDWDHNETPAGLAEVFKRLFQSGSKARFIGVSWASDMSRRIGEPLAYGSDVIGAFVAAPYVKNRLEQAGFTGADTTVLAHSLGNILVSSAISDQNLAVGKYILLNPAVPVEAYDGRNASSADYMKMIHPDWKTSGNLYSERVMCAGWGGLFSNTDPRSQITWNGRLGSVISRANTFQFFSTGEEILRQPEGNLPDLGILKSSLAVMVNWLPWVPDVPTENSLLQGEFVWVYNEMSKGQPRFFDQLFVENHKNAGWRFNADRYVPVERTDANGDTYTEYIPMTASQADGLATTNLIALPFFDKFQDETDDDIPEWRTAVKTLYTNDGTNVTFPTLPLANASMKQIKWHAKLLAEAVPPLSGPAGSQAVQDATESFDMMTPSYRNLNLWPTTRPGKSDGQQRERRWLHGDYKDAPFLLTHALYEKFVAISN